MKTSDVIDAPGALAHEYRLAIYMNELVGHLTDKCCAAGAGASDAPTDIVGLELHGDVALLRSLVVSPEKRAIGAGTALVEHAEQFARDTGVRSIYLPTTTAEHSSPRAATSEHGANQRRPRSAPPESSPESVQQTPRS